jgi:uncharacterized protein involved in exopolysaccharide biosynthesis
MDKEQQSHQTPDQYDDEIDLREIWNTLRKGWLTITLCAILGAAIGVFVALTAEPRYRAEVLVGASESKGSSGLSSLAGQFGGLAAIAGIDLPGQGNVDQSLAILDSRNFTALFITENKLLPVLFSDKWDFESNAWKNKDTSKQPTLNDAVKLFKERICNVSKDKKTGMITLSIEWKNPQLAAEWANKLIVRVNAIIREKAISDTEKTLQYLGNEIGRTSVVEVRQSIYGLIESQVKTMSIARTRDDYAFTVFDPAVASDLKSPIFPKKKLIVVIGLLGGLLIGFAWVLIKKNFK